MMTGMSVAGFNHGPRRGRNNTYSGTARLLHWVIAVLVVMQYATKLVPVGAYSVVTEKGLEAWHLAIGPMILALMAVRLAWRLTHRVPPPPGDLPTILQFVSRATHWLFYAILLLLPVLGWIAASGYGETSYLFGLIPLPALVTPDERLGGEIGQAHGILAWVLLAIIVLHLVGAMYHALVKNDGILGRMLPGLK